MPRNVGDFVFPAGVLRIFEFGVCDYNLQSPGERQFKPYPKMLKPAPSPLKKT